MQAAREERGSLKSLNIWQKKRRLKALEGIRTQRSQARENELALRRNQSQPITSSDPSATTTSGAGESNDEKADGSLSFAGNRHNRQGYIRAKESRKQYASQLSVLEWLIDVPEDLHVNWYVMPRPEGPRCLLIAQNGSTISRYKNGSFHKKFQSCLPNGSRETRGASKGSRCVLDVVFQSSTNTFYVVDCMQWEDYSLLDCDFEFRRFWLNQRFPEVMSSQQQTNHNNPHASESDKFVLQVAPVEIATKEMLTRAYSESMPYAKEGLIFIHKESPYLQGQQTPLCLQWKDAACSKYPIDTDARGNVLEKQSAILQLGQDQRSVSTGDSSPLTLGTLPQHFVDQNSSNLQPGTLFRFNLGPGGLNLAPDGHPVGANHELSGIPQNRAAADTISRIIFQHLARTKQITFEKLLTT
jgi:snurportin-1